VSEIPTRPRGVAAAAENLLRGFAIAANRRGPAAEPGGQGIGPVLLPVPLHVEDGGAIRIGVSRVLLELAIRTFEEGATPEQIVHSYDTLQLADVYAVIALYLSQKGAVDEYLRVRAEEAGELRHKIEASQESRDEVRARILGCKEVLEATRAQAAN
jgi:uncharacterized protein (DUF433 family)